MTYNGSKYFALFTLLIIYYFMGGEKFPDYENYVRITEAIGRDDPLIKFELVPTLILTSFYSITLDPKLTVDLYIFFLHLFYIFWLYAFHKGTAKNGMLLFTLLVAPLALTSTIRAAFAYVAVSYYIASKGRVKNHFSLPLLLFGILSHYSSLIIIFIYLVTKFFISNKNFNNISIFTAVCFGIFLATFNIRESSDIIAQALLMIDLQDRLVYVEEATSLSFLKVFYWLFIGYFVYTVSKSKRSTSIQSNFMIGAYLVLSVLFSINSVIGIRLAVYLIGIGVLIKGNFLILTETKSTNLGRFDILLAIVFFFLSIADILSNTGKF